MRIKQKRILITTVIAVMLTALGAGGFVMVSSPGNKSAVAPSVPEQPATPAAEPTSAPAISLPPPTPGTLGISDNLGHLPQSTLESRLDAMKRAGVQWLRKDIEWRGAERVKGTYDWSVNESTVATISRYGIKPLLILGYAPAWAAGAGNTDCRAVRCSIANTTEAIEAFGAFAGEAAKKFCNPPYNAAAFEIWNEPNLSKYWPQPDPVLYTKALRAASGAIRATGCNATIVLGGLGDTACAGCYTSTTFLQGVYASGGAGSFDAVGSHPYTRDVPVAASWRPAELHAIMALHGDGGKQVWATEFGYSSKALSPAQRSNRMRAAALIYRSYPWAGPIFWFGLGTDLTDVATQPGASASPS